MKFYTNADYPTPSVVPSPELSAVLVADAVDAYCWKVHTQIAYLELTKLL